MSSLDTERGQAVTNLSAVEKIVYCCYGGTHSSPVAAAIHLRRLPRDRIPTREELMQVPLFDRVTAADRGRAFLVGVDHKGREVFVLGRGPEKQGIEAALRSGWAMAGRDEHRLFLINTLVCVNTAMRIGGLLSRALGLVRIGRPIVLRGTQWAYRDLCRLVARVEEMLDGGTVPPLPPSPHRDMIGER